MLPWPSMFTLGRGVCFQMRPGSGTPSHNPSSPRVLGCLKPPVTQSNDPAAGGAGGKEGEVPGKSQFCPLLITNR